MVSQEALVGMRVKVREDCSTARLRGLKGTITKRWGDPDYLALDVLLDDRRTQLLWHHELEVIDGTA